MNSPLRYFYLALFGAGSRLYYRNLRVSGLEHFPKNGPVLVNANHSNAFWDALMGGVFLNRHLWFLARSDVFNTPLKQKLLHAHGVLPIYRLQEGINSLDKNKEAFQTCYDFLSKGEVIAIFPEGNCFRESYLRPLKKGAARIAFGAAQYRAENKDLKIISIGINYDDPDQLGSDLNIVISKPMNLHDYWPLFEENQVKAVNKLTDDIRKQLDSVHINLHHKPHHQLFFFLKKYFPNEAGLAADAASAHNYFQHLKHLSEQFNQLCHLNHQELFALDDTAKEYRHLLKKYRLRPGGNPRANPYFFQDLMVGIIVLLAGFPVFLAGWILNIIPFKIPFLLAKKIVKQKEFFTSVNLVVGHLLFFFWYLFLFTLFLLQTHSFSAAFIATMVSFLFGWAALHYYRRTITFFDQFRWMRLKKQNKEQSSKLEALHLEISVAAKNLFQTHKG
jgi:glycerol-3-phosphate O-acyltransferase / dihydroxyacetone phosphate acyltransferase